MEKESCKSFDHCGAPLCPLDEESMADGIWYPIEEEICTKHRHPFILMQRKIAKKASGEAGYFTPEMLKSNCMVKGGILGIDPERDEKMQLIKWLKAHKPKRIRTAEERAEIGSRLQRKTNVT